jgi:hypothetical protein
MDHPTKPAKVQPVDLIRMARSIAQSYGDKGAVVLSVGDDGVRIGVHGLNAKEIQDALCVGIHYNFEKDEG